MSSRHLAARTWPSLEDQSDLILLVPVGSCEQHGPHLPLDTDTRIAVAVASAVAEDRSGVVVAPPVAFGASGEHQSFAGTLSIGTEALTTVLVELARSALPPDDEGPFGRVIFVNGHGGNAAAAVAAVAVLRRESRPVSVWSPSIPDGDAHAGRTETSLLLHLDSAAVGEERPVGDDRPLAEIAGILRTVGVAGVSANGVLGDARGATPDEGADRFSALVVDLAAAVDESGHATK